MPLPQLPSDNNPFLSGMLDGITANGLVQSQKIAQAHLAMLQDREQRMNAMSDLDSRLRMSAMGAQPVDASGGVQQSVDLGPLPGTGQTPGQLPGLQTAPAQDNTLQTRLQADPSRTWQAPGVNGQSGPSYQLPTQADQMQRMSAIADMQNRRAAQQAGAVQSAKLDAISEAHRRNLAQNGVTLPPALAEELQMDPNEKVDPNLLRWYMQSASMMRRGEQGSRAKFVGFTDASEPLIFDPDAENGPQVTRGTAIQGAGAQPSAGAAPAEKPVSRIKLAAIESTKARALAVAEKAYSVSIAKAKIQRGKADDTDPFDESTVTDALDTLHKAKQAAQDGYEGQLNALGIDTSPVAPQAPAKSAPAAAPAAPKAAGTPSTSAKGKQVTADIAARFLGQAGGDKAKARTLAKGEGYNF